MSNLENAKEIVKQYYKLACCGIFNSRNIVGDVLYNIYNENGLTIDYCEHYSYLEVFGLSDHDFAELERFYKSLMR